MKNRTAVILKGDINKKNTELWLKWIHYADNLFESLAFSPTHYGVDGEDFKKVSGIRTAKRFRKRIYDSISKNHNIDYLEIYNYYDGELTIFPKNCPLYLSRRFDAYKSQGYIFLEFLSGTISTEKIEILIKELLEYIIVDSGEVVECLSSSEMLINRLNNTYDEDESKKIINKDIL